LAWLNPREFVLRRIPLIMNNKQRWVIGVGSLLILLMCIVPPWKGVRRGGIFERDRPVIIGYKPVFDPPRVDDAAIDVTRLVLQIAGVSLASVCLFFILKDRKT
jgi:hypothetical protein